MVDGTILAVSPPDGIGPTYVIENFPNVTKIVFAAALGLLLGTEREWAQKPAGMRTFTIITLIATVMTIVDRPALLMLGGALVVFQGGVFAVRGLLYESENYLLTTAVAMILAYGVGVLIGEGMFFEGVLVGVLATLFLVLRRELHRFAEGLTREEIRSTIEFAVIAFVVFPLLPNEPIGPWGAINLQAVWLLVVAVSAIGFVNYLIVQWYGTKGIAVTSFSGGIVNSAAVVGELVSRTRNNTDVSEVAVGAILLANAAMALRDLFIATAFVPELFPALGGPLIAIVLSGVILSYLMSDWSADIDLEFESPFNLLTALKFGGLFLVVLILSAGAQDLFGSSGFLVSSFFSGLISSGAVTTSAVLLVQSGQLSVATAAYGVVTGVSASILVKVGLAMSLDRSLARPVAIATCLILGAGLGASWVVAFIVG